MSALFAALLIGMAGLLSWPLGKALVWAMQPGSSPGRFRLRAEAVFLRAAGFRHAAPEQDWKGYVRALLVFNGIMFAAAYAALACQHLLPLNPDGRGPLEAHLLFNTITAFITNTDLQHYSGEASLSHFSQLALMWLQFTSAATGLAALTALARALSGTPKLGCFMLDLLRAALLVLLPLSLLLAVLLLLCGVPMTFSGALSVKTLEGAVQTIARGPVAAFVAIKQMGTNGGGFFGANSAHPFENPGFISNMLESVSIPLLPMAAVWMFGHITQRMRHAAVIFSVMAALLLGQAALSLWAESKPAPALAGLPVQVAANMEGKELRFGPAAGPLWAALTTATSSGSVNCMHDSLNPLAGLAAMIGMWLNVAFGGIGVGLINMFLYIIVGVFICGMMVGRSPEYCSRKVETHEMKLALLALLLHPLLILGGTALFAVTSWGAGTVHNPGAHGFSEILYEFSSAAANNGSGFEGLGDNTAPWNIAAGLVMLLGRYLPIILPLAIAGSLASKKPVPETSGTLRTDTALFGMIILGSVVFIGALLFLPAAVLGPVAEHLATIKM
ncbi:potassium-transporting ATPase subunit KdpA [Candidatus Electronema sp. JM]|uniref:potassium-transporting ATPase subunit KdpA n=1 Tax=Candidatus Electronema sp. JM TaxID=3401571 RepID=UPI003AA89AB0